MTDDFLSIVMEELNVKKVRESDDIDVEQQNSSETNGVKISLDVHITPELRLEGQAREIIRAVQAGRKKAGLDVSDRIILSYDGFLQVFDSFGALIASEVLAEEVNVSVPFESEYSSEVVIDGEKFSFGLKKVS